MYVEIILKIITAIFTVFGLYAFAHAIEESCFRSDKIHMTVDVDSQEVADQIEMYLDEAKSAYFIHGNDRISVIIMEELASKELTELLEKRHIRYHIVADDRKIKAL